MLEDELNLVMKRSGSSLSIVWIDRGLHASIKLLREEIEKSLALLCDADTVLFAMGLCGNALEGLRAEHSRLIIPRFGDCIAMELEVPRQIDAFYYTRGWLKGEQELPRMYEKTREKYGEEKAKKVLRTVLGNYHAMSVIDTKAYPLEETCATVRNLAERFHLDFSVSPGNTSILERLVTGQWDARHFCIIEPGECIRTLELLSSEDDQTK